MATKPPAEKVSIFLTVDNNSIGNYFNSHDPAPLYCRQLSNDFQNYLISSVALTKRYSVIDYKVFCGENASMRFLVEPLMQSIRKHFHIKKELKKIEFKKFKRRNFFLLLVSICIVMACQGLLPEIFNQDHRDYTSCLVMH